MNKFIKKNGLIIIMLILLPIFFFFLIGIDDSLAQPQPGPGGGIYKTPGGGIPNPIGTESFTKLLEKIIGYLILIGAPILALMVLYGGFLILTAGGSPEKFKTGKDVILYAVIGYIIILVSWGVIYIIGEILGAPDIVNKI